MTTTSTKTGPALKVQGLEVGYGSIPVVHGIDFEVAPGELVVLLGANGAGKTTTLQAVAGEIPARRGSVMVNGRPARGPLSARARSGVAYLPEGRSVIRRLSVRDNLKLGRGPYERALDLAPELEKLLDRKAGLLSGGEQQILCLARLLSSDPAIVLADEMSMGLAPLVVERMLHAAREAADRGVGVLLVEQHAKRALSVADRAYLMHRGRIVTQDKASVLLENLADIERVYLTGAAESDTSRAG